MMNDINYRGESISYSGGATRTRGFGSERCIWKQLTADVCVCAAGINAASPCESAISEVVT
jgi:hypothetical protein